MSGVGAIILWGALLTYLARIGGHLLLRRVGALPPRAQAALDAVPAAMLTAIVAPSLVSGGWPERGAIVLCTLLALRAPQIVTVLAGVGAVAAGRAFGL